MNAQEYISKGHSVDANGWTITLQDYPNGEECPVAIHNDTGAIYHIVYNEDWRDEEPRLDDNMAHYSRDWASSPLDDYWGNPAKLIECLRDLYAKGLLRVEGAIHGLPGASSLGAIFC